MQPVKSCPQLLWAISFQRLLAARHGDLVALAGIAQVEGALDTDALGRKPVAAELFAGLRTELCEHLIDVGRQRGLQPREPRAHVIVAHIRHDEANCGEHAGIERHDHSAHAEIARNAPGVERAGAAKGEQHEIAQVVPTHGGDRLDRLLHFHVDNADDSLRDFSGGEPEGACDLALERRARLPRIEPQLAAEEIMLAQIAQHEIAVGDGRHLAAAAIARRARHCARALWADLQQSETIDAGDGAAAGAHGIDVQHGHGEIAAFDLAAARNERLAVLDQRHVAGRAAHVEGDGVLPLQRARQRGACRDPAGGAGEHGGDGSARGGCEGGHPAVRLHHVFLSRSDPGVGKPVLEPGDIERENGLQIGVDDGRAQPIILSDLRQHLARQRHAAIRHLLQNDLAHPPLVLGAKKRE